MKNIKQINNKGITLITLIITIIVLLILAGITVVTLTDNNSILQKIGKAKNDNIDSQVEEDIKLAWNKVYTDDYINNYTIEKKAAELLNELTKTGYVDNNTKVTGKGNIISIENYRGKNKVLDIGKGRVSNSELDLLPVIKSGEEALNNSNALYISGDYTAVIPAGFTVSKDENSIENGLVVKDGNNNEWVWIPVNENDFKKMYETCNENNELLKINDTQKVTTKYKSKSSTDIRNDLVRGNINSQSWREPVVLENSSLDGSPDNRKIAGFIEKNGSTSSLETMAIKLKDDYEEMIDSIGKNGGFYVGRYELGKNGTKPQVKAGDVMNGINWYKAYSSCKSFSNEYVESRMIWGCQWDQVCRFLHNHGDKIDLNDSKTYGNYRNSFGTAATNRGSLGNPASTGTRNEAWKINNIYDFAGNGLEWAQEAYDTYSRGYRGRYL